MVSFLNRLKYLDSIMTWALPVSDIYTSQFISHEDSNIFLQ